MLEVEIKEFDEELEIMRELMADTEISLTDKDFRTTIAALNLKRAVTVDLGTSVRQCIEIMVARRIGCLVVVSGGELAGIFTERDILMKIAGQGVDLNDLSIDAVMTRHPVALRQRDSLETAVRLMHVGRYRHVAIVDGNGQPAWVMSIKDIVAYIAEFFPQDILNLPPHPIRLGTRNREGA